MGELETLREELNRTRERLHSVKAENELYLKEIHHRMKNSLSVVSGLLKLNATYIKDEEAKRQLLDGHQRIIAISLLHEKLFKARDTKDISFGKYVRSLADSLFRSYGVEKGNIKMNIDMPDVGLTEKSRVPCALMINELLSNSLKHAFSQSEKGEITVKLKRAVNGFILCVTDTGCGLPEGLNIVDGSTFGLILVSTLAEQLGGELELLRQEGGAGFKIFVPRGGLIEL
jgi:two-component sensor histidine kinase